MALSKSILDRIFKIFVKHGEDIDSDANGVLIAGRTATGKGKMPLLDSDGHIQTDILSGGGGADPAQEDGHLATINEKLGLDKTVADAGKIADGSIVFDAGDNLTTEKQTADISLAEAEVHSDGLYLLAIEKPAENTAKNLTVYVYNEIKIDGTNQRDVLHTTHTVEKITDVATYCSYIIQGLFIGEGKIKLGMKFAVDSGAITVKYRLYRL